MGLLDKMKNLFTEEVEDEPVKSEVMQVEIPAPVKKEEVEEKDEFEDSVSDSNVIKKEEKSAPIFFDDAYFKELEQPKVVKKEVKSSYMKERREDKKFTPTPIISPVYGVLDKNYNKEDITTKKERESITQSSSKTTIDDVRKKAYGTLEDDIETTLFGSNSILFTEEKEDDEKDLFEELVEDKIEDINIIEEEMENNMIEDILDERSISNSELFDLIDSMYEKEGK